MKAKRNVIYAGTAIGTIYLLARWVTGNALFSSEQSLVKFGILFSIILSGAYGVAFIILSFFMKRVNRENVSDNYFTYRFQQINGQMNQRFVQLICYFVQLELWLVQTVVLSEFYKIVFGNSNVGWLTVSIVCMAFIYIVILNKTTQTMAMLYTILLFVTLTIIPIYYFILNGSKEIYNGIRLFHPYLLYFKDSSYTPFYIALFIIAVAHIFCDLPTWHALSNTKKQKRSQVLWTTGALKILIGFSFTAILLIAIYKGPFENFEILLLSYLYVEHSMLLSYLFATFCVASIFLPLTFSIRSLETVKTSNTKILNILFAVTIFIGILMNHSIRLLDLVIYFGIVYVAVFPLFLFFLFSRMSMPKFGYLYFLGSIIVGEMLYVLLSNILIALFTVLILGLLFYYFTYRSKKSD